MHEERDLIAEEREEREEYTEENEAPEVAEHPVCGIKHEYEPDAENIMPAEDRPGTF